MVTYKTYEEAKKAYEDWKGKNTALMKEAQYQMIAFEKQMNRQAETVMETCVAIEEPVQVEITDNPIRTKAKRRK